MAKDAKQALKEWRGRTRAKTKAKNDDVTEKIKAEDDEETEEEVSNETIAEREAREAGEAADHLARAAERKRERDRIASKNYRDRKRMKRLALAAAQRAGASLSPPRVVKGDQKKAATPPRGGDRRSQVVATGTAANRVFSPRPPTAIQQQRPDPLIMMAMSPHQQFAMQAMQVVRDINKQEWDFAEKQDMRAAAERAEARKEAASFAEQQELRATKERAEIRKEAAKQTDMRARAVLQVFERALDPRGAPASTSPAGGSRASQPEEKRTSAHKRRHSFS